MGRVAFITGATGFVGRHLVPQLVESGWRVRTLVRPSSDTRHLERCGVELHTGDLGDRDALSRGVSGTDTVFHLAAITAARTEREYVSANVDGTRAVVEAILAGGPNRPRLVYLSSYAAGGPSLEGRPRTLNAPPRPLTAYGRTKLAGEVIARDGSLEGLEVVVIRAPAVYGAGGRDLLTYFRLVRWRLAPVPGGEDRRLHMIFAPDLGLALRRSADVSPDTYAVADPVEYTWGEVVAAIADALGRSAFRLPLPPFLVRSVAAATETFGRAVGRAVPFNREKAEEMLAPAWTCDLSGSEVLLRPGEATPLREGIAETVRWYRRQGWL